MRSVLVSLLQTLRTWARSRAALQLEVLALRHQLHVLRRSRPRLRGAGGRVALGRALPCADRMAKVIDPRHPDRVLATPAYAGEIGHVVADETDSAPVCACG